VNCGRLGLDDMPRGESERDGVVLQGKYRLVSHLGAGGMGTVSEAEHVELGQRLAVKFLREDLARRPDAVRRFLQEARVLAKVRHQNVVRVVDTGQHDGCPYYVMELLEGEDLRSLLRRVGPWSWAQTRAVALQIGAALAAAHMRGIVHRDLKPENCFCLAPEGGDRELFIKVIDFGIAKDSAGVQGQLTGTGELLGTVGYMSLEQLNGASGPEVDVYALAVMLYEMLAGQLPYAGSQMEVITRLVSRSPAMPLAHACPGVASAIDALVMRAISVDPAQRFVDMTAFTAAIAAIPADAPPRAGIVVPGPAAPTGATDIGHAATMLAAAEAVTDTPTAVRAPSPAMAAPSGTPTATVTAAAPSGTPTGRVTAAAPGGMPTGRVTAAAPSGTPTGRVTAAAPGGTPAGRVTAAAPGGTPRRMTSMVRLGQVAGIVALMGAGWWAGRESSREASAPGVPVPEPTPTVVAAPIATPIDPPAAEAPVVVVVPPPSPTADEAQGVSEGGGVPAPPVSAPVGKPALSSAIGVKTQRMTLAELKQMLRKALAKKCRSEATDNEASITVRVREHRITKYEASSRLPLKKACINEVLADPKLFRLVDFDDGTELTVPIPRQSGG